MATANTVSSASAAHGRSMVGSEYVCVGSPEETLLETYFIMLSKFNFDRAKDQCDRERESKGGATNWCEFMTVLGKLAMAELSYYNLSFMGRSWIIKKESLKAQYDALLTECRRVQQVYYHGRGGTSMVWERRMADLLAAVAEFIIARKSMTDVYKSQELMADGCHGNSSSWYRVLKDTQDKHRNTFQHEYLAPLRNNFTLELGILLDLVQAQLKMADWQFLPSLLCLQGSHTKLLQWCGLQLPGTPVTDTSPRLPSIRSRPRLPSSPTTMSSTSLSSTPPPSLYRWLSSLHTSLMAKFTLYFYRLLSNSGMMAEVKGLSSKFDVDYIQTLLSLVRQSQTCCVCLVFDSTGLDSFTGPDYHIPPAAAASSSDQLLTGLNCYPIMTAVPADFDFLPHRANIVSMVMSRGQPSAAGPVYDTKLQCCYHMVLLEPRVTMVGVVNQYRRREKDSAIITALNDIASKLKNQHIFQLLKQNSN